MEIKKFFKNAFNNMKESAKAQHEVDKAQFEAVKAESRANFEENRGHNTLAKAKADAKNSFSERAEKIQKERDSKIADAKECIEKANARYNIAKKS